MTGLVKNQIVKQLARFTKNLSPNKISVKFMKGEGELHNLELNEKFLSELLELPPWLRLTKAVCNKISAKIHWTKLKTDPICLYLDRVEVNMEAVDCPSKQPRPTIHQQPTKEKAPNRYGFVEKVVDGMYVQINSVIISFKSSGFQASFQMSRLVIQSTNPDWKPEDLRQTRVKDEQRGEVLTFKDITWSTLRIDANALYDEKDKSCASSPLRLITSHSALHLTIKKRLEDCAVLSARLELILDDILWVLTHTQLQALAGFASSVNQAMERAEGKNEEPVASVPAGQATQQPQYVPKKFDGQRDGSSVNALFSMHDVPETSYHLTTGQIDFHLCDDSGLSSKERDPGANGAMHFQMKKLSLDHYPYHLAGTSRTCWPCHNEASLARAYWVNQLLNAFRALRNRRSNSVSSSSTPHGAHSDGTATSVDSRTGNTQPQANSAIPPSPRIRNRVHVSPLTSPQSNPSPPSNQRVGHSLSSAQKRPVFMYESCFVIRCDDFVIKQVTTSTTSGEGAALLSSDKNALYLPSDMPAFQVDYTHYYYPSNNTSPVPAPNLFVQLNPIQFTFDINTCIWFNRFLRRLLENKIWSEGFPQETSVLPTHVDIRVEALMPKVIIPCPSDPCAHYGDLRPQALQAQMSQASMTNTRIGANSTQTDLLVFLQRFNASKLYSDFLSFPNEPEDVRPLPNNIWLNDYSLLSSGREVEKLINGTRDNFLKSKQPAQVWCISAEQVWLDFVRIGSMGNRPMPFVDAVPLSIWVCTPLPGVENSTQESEPNPSDVAVHSGKSAPDVVREERSQAKKRQTYWSGTQSGVASGAQSPTVFSPDLVDKRKFSKPVPSHLMSNCLQNASSTPDLQQFLSQGECGVVVDRTVDGSNLNGKYTMADSAVRQDRPCSSVPSSPRRPRKDNLGSQVAESASAGKNPLRLCLSDSASLRSLPESDSSGSQDGFVLLGRQPNEAPPAYEVLNDLPPPYEPYSQQQGPVQNGFGGSPCSEAPETLLQEAPALPEKVPLSCSAVSCSSGDIVDGQNPNPGQQDGLSVLVALTDRVNVRFDHFQLMFLFRMQEMLLKMQEDMERENAAFERAAQEWKSSPAVTCFIITQELELNVILPPKPEADTSTSSQNTSAMGSYHDADILSDGRADSPESNHLSRLALEKGSICSSNELLSPGRKSKTRSTSSANSLLISRPESAQSTGEVSGRISSASIPDTEAWSMVGQVGRRGSDSGSSINLDSGVSLKDSNSRQRNSGTKRVRIFAVEGSGVHVGIQLKEADTVVTVTGQEVKIDEQGTVHFEKYLNQKSLRTSRDKEPIPVSSSSDPVVRVRAVFGPGAKRHELAGERGFAHVKLMGVATSLLISSIQGLAECFEDELVLPPVPFLVELTNSRVTFNNDVPPTLLSAPPSVPINVAVEDVLIRRDQEGLISIKAIDTCSGIDDTDAPKAEKVTRQDSIRSSSELSLSDSVSSRIDSLENELSVSRTALRSIHDERQALLRTVARLQQELLMSNREQERMQEKLIGQRRGGTANWY